MFGQLLAAAFGEDVCALGAVRTHEAAHVLNNAQHRDSSFFAERQLSPDVVDWHRLEN